MPADHDTILLEDHGTSFDVESSTNLLLMKPTISGIWMPGESFRTGRDDQFQEQAGAHMEKKTQPIKAGGPKKK